MNEIEYWYRPRFAIQGHVLIKKDKIPIVIESDLLEMNTVNVEDPIVNEVHSHDIEKVLKSKKPQQSKNNKAENASKKAEKKICAKNNTDNKHGPLNKKSSNQVIILEEEQENKKELNEDTAKEKQINNHEEIHEIKRNRPSNLNFRCPDSKCDFGFNTSQDLIDHLNLVHSLTCKMPFCSFSCYTFQDYSDHFQSIHCNSNVFPYKRGPVTSLDRSSKHLKPT